MRFAEVTERRSMVEQAFVIQYMYMHISLPYPFVGRVFFISLENVRKSCIIAGKGRFFLHLQTRVSKNHVTEM